MAGRLTILDQVTTENYTAIWGECVHALSDIPSNSVGHIIYSPPFGSLFTYSPSAADLGNVASDEEFFASYDHVIRETFRVLKPGRLAAVHCTDLPTRKAQDGYIGLKPFSDQVLAAHLAAGFIFHCRVIIRKSPVVEMTRTKALGLLHKQLKKDSCMSRMGLPDYLLFMRKPGDNPEPVTWTDETFPVSQWQEWAEAVWMDIDQSDTLNVRMAREPEDERHLCPLQLPLIRRSIMLYSNPGDVVLSPFMGIGSEGYEAVKLGRRYVGIELAEKYYRPALRYLAEAEAERNMGSLFDHPITTEAAE
jgi:hypothetical protein